MTHMITLEDDIAASREHAYDAFLAPEGLRQWHRASADWTTPHAEVDPQVGGRFNIGYGDPTGENTFDFTGSYTELDRPNRIAYTIDDGRKVEVELTDAGNGMTHVKWSFEPEGEFPEDMQREGWAGQLTNLKRYLEND